MQSKTRITAKVREYLSNHTHLTEHLSRVEALMYAHGDIFAKLSLRYHYAIMAIVAKPKAWQGLCSEHPMCSEQVKHFKDCLGWCASRVYNAKVLSDQHVALLIKYTMFDLKNNPDASEALIPYIGDFQWDYWDYSLERRTVKSQAFIE